MARWLCQRRQCHSYESRRRYQLIAAFSFARYERSSLGEQHVVEQRQVADHGGRTRPGIAIDHVPGTANAFRRRGGGYGCRDRPG
ncbi:hypothetical protein EMIT0P253_40227 [Pseudomonas sp. IT-P253]